MVKFPQLLSGMWSFAKAFNGLTRRIQTTVEHMRVTNAPGEATDMVRGELIALQPGIRQAVLTDATTSSIWAGVMTEDVLSGESGIARINGFGYCLFDPALTLTPGDPVYVSEVTPGRATNVAPSGVNEYVQRIGTIADTSPYATATAAWVWLQHCCTPSDTR